MCSCNANAMVVSGGYVNGHLVLETLGGNKSMQMEH